MQQLNKETAKLSCTYPEKILQFGGGNFLRAFADWMFDILNEQTGFNSCVLIVKPTAKGDYQHIRRQDGLYYVYLNGIKDGKQIHEFRLIKCVSRVLHPYLQWSDYLASAENPDMRFIVSNTTESGITFNDQDRFGDAPPKEFPAKLTAWLYHRYQCFLGDENKGCIFLPCELIEQNGDSLRQCILHYAELWGLGWDFQKWIIHYNYFCNTLVDRIVAGFPQEQCKALQQQIGFQDNLLVAGEHYHSWIIQAPESVLPELPFSKTNLNVRLVKDLGPYREMKVRLLNGAHTAMVPIGLLMGIQTVRGCMENEITLEFIKETLRQEIGPTLSSSSTEVDKFIENTIERFQNPTIKHRLLSIALNSISKFKTRLLPSLLQFQHQNKKLPKRIVFAMAALIHFYKGTWKGEVVPLKDDSLILDFFRQTWEVNRQSIRQIASEVLANKQLWGRDLNQIPELTNLLSDYLVKIDQKGISPTLKKLDKPALQTK